MPTTTKTSAQIADAQIPAMGRALRQGLNIPVCALRASIDALTREIPRHREGRVLLRGAIEEVERLDRNVHELMAYAHAPELHLLPARALEVLKSAQRALCESSQARVHLLDFTEGEKFLIDAPLLANALRRVLDNALEATADDVLLVARYMGDSTGQLSLSIVNGRSLPLDGKWAFEAFRTTKPNHLGLGLTLAMRDIELHGGALSTEALSFGGTRILLKVPAAIVADPASEETLAQEVN